MQENNIFEKIFVSAFFCTLGFGFIFLFQQEKGISFEWPDSKGLLTIQAALGNADKQYLLALQSEPDEAYELYRKAASKGHLDARLKLAFIYENGSVNPELKNIPKALEIYNSLAEENITQAQIALCRIYMFDKADVGFVKDSKRSFEWCKKAAENNHPDGFYFMSIFYLYKSDIPKEDLDGGVMKGSGYLNEAIRRGSPRAQKFMQILRDSCLTKDQIVHSKEQALDCETLAYVGDRMAQFITGGMYHTGSFFDKDIRRAVYWLRASAAQKNAKASIVLGTLYADGKDGVVQNESLALRYFNAAVRDGNFQERLMAGMMRRMLQARMKIKKSPEADTEKETPKP